MLREARIVMPIVIGELTARTELRDALVKAFGGYTKTKGAGVWFSDVEQQRVDDSVEIYEVAIEAERDASWDKLFQIAMTAGRALGQTTVYIRYPDGSVEIEPVNGREGLGALQSVGFRQPPVWEPLGARRIPQVGETWHTSQGDLVAVVSPSTKIGGGFNVVILSLGDSNSSWKPGATYVVDLDGCVLPDKSSHPRDLKRFVKNF